MTHTLHLGDCLAVLRTLPDNSIDSIVTDPPYGLAFMGKRWDYDVPGVEVWTECLRVLKPGGYLLAFAGTRTQHRMACRIEDAGFELRDMIAWLYGSGFPKSHNGAWGGTALKPAMEPITVARKPLIGTVSANFAAHGTGGLNIDGCRVEPTGESRERVGEASQESRYTDAGGTNFAAKPGIRGGDPAGRWPANVVHDGSDEVGACFPHTKSGARRAGEYAGSSGSVSLGDHGTFSSRAIAASEGNAARFFQSCRPDPDDLFDDEGFTAVGERARFFYCAKASRADRNAGCDALEKRPLHWSSGDANPGSFQSEGTDKSAQNFHPTVKPTNLMRWLCRLVTPRGGVVLDPFMGSGSTGRGALLEGFGFIGIEREPDYLAIAELRVADAAEEAARLRAAAEADSAQADLFGAPA